MRFADTNILIYAVSPMPEDASKRSVARGLLNETDLALSVQVLQEFYAQVTRPPRPLRPWVLTHSQALAFLEPLYRFPIRPVDLAVLREAFAIRTRFGLNYWDCAILAAARLLGCEAVYSEDMSATQDYDGLRVINPFAHLPQPA